MLSAQRLALLVLLVPLVSIECYVTYEKCDSNEWYKYNGNCYSFGSDKLSFYDAEDYCRSQGSHLLSVHSKEEANFLQQLIEDRRFYGRRWIGLNILEGKNKYSWTDGSPANYLDFYDKKQYKIEKCYILYTKGAFRPEHCELRYTTICKKSVDDVNPTPIPPITPETPEGNCPSDWLQIGQKCFRFFDDLKTFRSAKLSCIALGENHDLASVHSMKEQAFLTQKMGDLGMSVWIGFSQVESDEIGHELVYGWTDNSRVNFTHWAPGYPQRNTWETCIRLSNEGVGKGFWIGDFCDHFKHRYVCGRPPVANLPPPPPPPTTCDDQSSDYRQSCYTLHSAAKSWDEAEKTCQGTGGHLVSVRDSFEEAFLFNLLDGKTDLVWNGLKTVDGTRILRWSDNEKFYYSNWDNFPQLTGVSSCTVMDTGSRLKWSSKDCSAQLPFVCRSSTGNKPVPEDVIGACPSGESSWIDIGDSFCYHVGRSQHDRYRWGGLSRYCLSKGMQMLSLNDEHQVKSLLTYLWKEPYNFWLGLIRTADKHSFMWVDQSPLNFTNWGDRQPSTYSTGQDCVSFSTSSSKWKVEGCEEWRGSICRARKIPME